MTGLPSPEHIREQCEELAVLLPALPGALERDAGTSSGERVTTSDNVHGIPINVDVADALRDLLRDIPEAAARAAQAAGETPTGAGGIPGHLQRLPALYERLSGLGRTVDARHLATQLAAWLTTARRALGLNQPDTPLAGPQHCPDHDQPLTPLVVPGDRGHLVYDHLDHGRPVDPWIRWDHHEVITCRHCRRTWTPAQYPWLGRLVAHANNRRKTTRAETVVPEREDAP